MATYAQFYPWIALECPNVPPTLMDDAILRAARMFSERTLAVEEEVTVVLADSDSAYTPTMAAGTEAFHAKEARIGAQYLASVMPAEMRKLLANTDAAQGQPMKYSVTEEYPHGVNVFPVPDYAYSINFVFAVRPTVTATTINDLYFTRYREAVVHYALYVLMAQVGQTWSNPDYSAAHHSAFTSRCADVKISQGNGRAAVENMIAMRPLA